MTLNYFHGRLEHEEKVIRFVHTVITIHHSGMSQL